MNSPRTLRAVRLACLALACATLLGACSLWPTGSSTHAMPAAAQVPPPPDVAPSAACTDCAPGVTPAAVAVAQSAAAPVELSPMPPAAVVAEPLTKTPKATTPVAPKSVATVALAHGFYINAGLYAVPGNASKAYSKLEHAGLPVFTEVVDKAHGPQTRVRVGPYPTRAKAVAASKKIKALKLDAVVFKH